ncbi:MAG: response regulator [Pseudomonadales bacterium]
MANERKKPTILVVDDHTPILHALKLRLKSANYNVVIAHDCVSGAMKARETNPDIAVLDVNLPGGSGFELAKRIDTICEKTVRKIFITASRDEEFRYNAKKCGAVEFLEKPFTSDTLFDAIFQAEDSMPHSGNSFG